MTPRPAPATAADDVVLVDDQGRPLGVAPRLKVHTSDTPLHLAFSTYLFNADGEVLITRRALGKKTWPGVWTNSCCGHPRPGESLEDAVRRRVGEELGAEIGSLLTALPDFRYRAVDASGVVENEICPVYVGFLRSDVVPNPDEVMDHRWVAWGDLVAAVSSTPHVYSPWASLQVPALAPRLPRLIAPHLEPTIDLATCLADVERILADELERLASAWRTHCATIGVDVLPDDLPGWLASLMLGAGKRFRVAMAYWGFVAAGGVPGGPGYATMLRAAAALETLHLFALIHDDVMDESTSRRGRPSAHVQAGWWHRDAAAIGDPATFGRNLAVLLGDLAHTQADALVDQLPAKVRTAWYDLCVELIAGQRADLTGAAAGRRDVPHAQQVARLKSGGYTVTRPLQLGALAAGASDEVLDALWQAGDSIGQAFALRDDILGAWGDPALTGKPSGDDLAEGKATVILALAHERLMDGDAEALQRLGTEAMRSEDVTQLQDALVRAGVRDEVERMIAELMDAAYAQLAADGLNPLGVEGLRDAARTVAWRNQ